MTNITDIRELKARIIVFGVGGGGGNAVNNMIAAGLQGVDFVVANTDAQALSMSKAKLLIQMGTQVTKGLGAGSQPDVGRAAAEEAIDAIRDHLTGAHMVFVTAGMGGGTGTGNATRLGASQRSTTRRCASHHIATQRASRWGHPGGSRALSADGPHDIAVMSLRDMKRNNADNAMTSYDRSWHETDQPDRSDNVRSLG